VIEQFVGIPKDGARQGGGRTPQQHFRHDVHARQCRLDFGRRRGGVARQTAHRLETGCQTGCRRVMDLMMIAVVTTIIVVIQPTSGIRITSVQRPTSFAFAADSDPPRRGVGGSCFARAYDATASRGSRTSSVVVGVASSSIRIHNVLVVRWTAGRRRQRRQRRGGRSRGQLASR
jgi:hypothetical protein